MIQSGVSISDDFRELFQDAFAALLIRFGGWIPHFQHIMVFIQNREGRITFANHQWYIIHNLGSVIDTIFAFYHFLYFLVIKNTTRSVFDIHSVSFCFPMKRFRHDRWIIVS